MGEHTPTPWSFSDGFILASGEALPVIGVQVPMVVGPKRLQAVANSKFIVDAVNSYAQSRATIDALVGALESAKYEIEKVNKKTNWETPDGVRARIDSALQLARGSKGE